MCPMLQKHIRGPQARESRPHDRNTRSPRRRCYSSKHLWHRGPIGLIVLGLLRECGEVLLHARHVFYARLAV